jgi:glycosyltransferase involved in cell wall biosynthesis
MTGPLLSVVCFASPHRERTRRCLAALGAQTAAEEIELILVDSGDPADRPNPPATLDVVPKQLPAEASLGQARATGIHAARGAPAVAFMSDHCYPEPGWAAALIDAYSGPWAAVGYAFRDLPGTTYGARAARIADHGRWLAGVTTGGAVDSISYGEASYRRDFLDAFGDSLEWVLDSDFSLQSAVHVQGLRMTVAPEAVITHDNLATVRANGLLSYHSSRLVGARHLDERRRGAVRRALYALAAPVAVPLLRTLRLVRDLRGVVPAGQLFAALPAIVIKNVYEGFGQAHGYLRGEGDAAKRLVDAELRWPRSAWP